MNDDSGKTRRPPPDAERWSVIEAAFAQADELREAELAAFLAGLERDDPSLCEEVNELLAARDRWWLDDPVATLPTPPEQEGDRIGAYELVRRLGRGGMGDVWLAVREGTDFRQHVALKIVRPGMESAELRAAFRAERQILGSLNHPNIAHLLDVGDTPDGRPYLVLEFVEGLPLTEYCDEHRLTITERLRLFRTICDGVRYAHQSLVIHHDIKPSNILVTKDRQPKLLDFGIARVLSPEFGAGPRLRPSAQARLFTPAEARDSGARRRLANAPLTPGYAAPEQLEGRATTTATDIYALGVVLYELLTGKRPYHSSGLSRPELLRLIREHDVTLPSAAAQSAEVAAARGTSQAQLSRQLSGDLDAIVRRAMAKDVSERYSSVEQLVADIDRSLDAHPVSARPRTTRYVLGRFMRRNRWAVTLGAVGASVVSAFVIALTRQSVALRERSAQAERERTRAIAVSSFLQQLFRGADPGDARGASITARELLDRGADRVEHELARQPATQADLLTVMSEIYQDLGLYDPAERLAAGAVTRARTLGNDSVLVAALIEHGKALHWKGNSKDAEARYREALDILRRYRDTTGTPAIVARTYLGAALEDQGKGSDAQRFYSTAITLERVRGIQNDTLLALTLNNFGVSLRHAGDLGGAESAHREALAIRRAALGNDHPEAIRSLNNVAVVAGARGDLVAAESLLTEVVERWKRVLGPSHPSVADALNTLGSLYLRKKDPRRAAQYYAESLAIRRERLGPKSPMVAQSLFNLGLALAGADDRAGALARYREALAIRVEVFGEQDASVKATRDAIAKVGSPR